VPVDVPPKNFIRHDKIESRNKFMSEAQTMTLDERISIGLKALALEKQGKKRRGAGFQVNPHVSLLGEVHKGRLESRGLAERKWMESFGSGSGVWTGLA
jgi:hypothetical protein